MCTKLAHFSEPSLIVSASLREKGGGGGREKAGSVCVCVCGGGGHNRIKGGTDVEGVSLTVFYYYNNWAIDETSLGRMGIDGTRHATSDQNIIRTGTQWD